MTDNAARSNYGLKDTGAAGELSHLLGAVAQFPDVDFSSSTPAAIRTGIPVMARWVRNGESSAAITPRAPVKWLDEYVGTRVVLCSDGDVPCGVASPYIPTAGAAAGESFYIIFDGPGECISDGTGVLADGDIVVTAGSKKVNKQTAAPADTTAAMVQVNSRVGVVMEDVTNVDGTTFRCLIGPLR